jgi:hypothetical protein
MSTAKLWTLAVVLVVGGFYVLFIHGRFGSSSAAAGSVKGYGTVRLKDTRPGPDGRPTNYATVDYEDTMRRNREVTIEVPDQGAFDRLQTGKEIPVYYRPEDPSKATLEGGTGMAGVTSPSLRFLAWTALLVGLFFGYQGVLALGKDAARPAPPISPVGGGDAPGPAAPRPPKITPTRR